MAKLTAKQKNINDGVTINDIGINEDDDLDEDENGAEINIEEKDVEADIPKEKVDSEEKESADKDAVKPVEVQTRKPRMVLVKTLHDHKCTIGDVSYYFEKGKEMSVPVNVKMILAKQNILKA